MTEENRNEWAGLHSRFREVRKYLPVFLKNPLESIKRVPNWDWPTVILLEAVVGMFCGALNGVLSRHFVAILGGLILGPIVNVIMTGLTAGVMYYACLFLMKTELDIKKVFTVVVFAAIPAQLLSILSPIAKPITLICVIVAALLLIVGFVENFMLDKKKMTQIIGGIAGILIFFWLYSVLMEASSNRLKVQDYTNESLDQIHKELNEGLQNDK